MDRLTSAEIERLDKSNVEFERCQPFAKLNDPAASEVVAYTLDKSAGAFNTAAVEIFTAPFAMRIDEIIVNAQVSEGSGVVTVYKGTDAVCTAIACDTDGAVVRMSAGAVVANKARLVLAAGDVVKAQSSGGTAANIRGIVTVMGHRL